MSATTCPCSTCAARRAGISESRRTRACSNAPTGPLSAQYREYWQADRRFHDLIAESANNRFLLMAYNCLGGQVQRFRLFTGLGVTDAEYAIKEHTAILAAFRSREPKKARRAMARHLRGVRARSIRDIVDRG